MHFIHLNACSLLSKIDKLHLLAKFTNIANVTATETWPAITQYGLHFRPTIVYYKQHDACSKFWPFSIALALDEWNAANDKASAIEKGQNLLPANDSDKYM